MTDVEIKARMFDLIQEKGKIEHEGNQALEVLKKQADKIKREADIKIAPILNELEELQSKL